MSVTPRYEASIHVPTDIYGLVPIRPLHDERRALPPGLVALSGEAIRSSWSLDVEPLAEDLLCLQMCGHTDFRARLTRSYHEQIHPDGLMIIPRGTPFDYVAHGTSTHLTLLLAPELFAATAERASCADSVRVELVERVAHADRLLAAVGRAMFEALQVAGVAADLYLESLMQTLIVHLLRYHAVFPVRPPSSGDGCDPDAVRRLRDYIHAHPTRNLTLAELSAIVGLSPYHLTRLFRRHTGQPLHQYVLTQRLTLAKQLLETSDLTISQIADQLGFADHSHFSRHFKRHFRAQPSAIKRPRKNIHNERKNVQDKLAG